MVIKGEDSEAKLQFLKEILMRAVHLIPHNFQNYIQQQVFAYL